MSTPCIIVNLSNPLDRDRFENETIIPPGKRPKYVHDDLESAEKEALRLHKEYAGPQSHFVIFQAVAQTSWRTAFEIAAPTIAVLEPMEATVQPIPERAPKKKRRKQP